jgi:hypothetical protein
MSSQGSYFGLAPLRLLSWIKNDAAFEDAMERCVTVSVAPVRVGAVVEQDAGHGSACDHSNRSPVQERSRALVRESSTLIATAISLIDAVSLANRGKPENLGPELRGLNRYSGHHSIIVDNGSGRD